MCVSTNKKCKCSHGSRPYSAAFYAAANQPLCQCCAFDAFSKEFTFISCLTHGLPGSLVIGYPTFPVSRSWQKYVGFRHLLLSRIFCTQAPRHAINNPSVETLKDQRKGFFNDTTHQSSQWQDVATQQPPASPISTWRKCQL
jgi:hypothetical protein